MHLVFATSIVPDGALATGYEIANAAIIDALRRAGVRVTVLGFTWPGKAPADPENTVVLGSVDVRTDSASPLQKLAWLTRRCSRRDFRVGQAAHRQPRQGACGAEGDRAVRRLCPECGAVRRRVRGLFDDKPSIFVAHNVEYRSAEENAAAAHSPFQKYLYSREARLLEGIERRLCDRADFVFTLAEEDRAALGVDAPRQAPRRCRWSRRPPATSRPASGRRSTTRR